jgi:hypothetical protein
LDKEAPEEEKGKVVLRHDEDGPEEQKREGTEYSEADDAGERHVGHASVISEHPHRDGDDASDAAKHENTEDERGG